MNRRSTDSPLANRIGLALFVVLLIIPASAVTAQTIDVITVDCTPMLSPGGSSFGPTYTMGMALQAVDTGGLFNVTEVTPAATA